MKKWFVSLCALLLLFTGCAETPAGGDAAPIQEQVSQPTSLLTPAPTDFIPAPLEPAELTEEQWKQMQQTKTCMTADGAVDLSTHQSASYDIRKYDYKSPNSFHYVDYYGTYQGYTAIRIHNTQIYGNDKEEVAGCTFYYSGYSDILFCRVLLWKDNIFYQLPYAYSQGLITAEDVQSIAHYNNLRHFEPTISASPVPDGPTAMPADFVPAPIEPAELSEDVWTRIQNTYQYVFDGDFTKGAPFIEEFLYYGTYQNYIAVHIYDTAVWGYWLWDETYLWKDDVFYRFQDALNLGLISDEDAKNIIYYHNLYYYKNING